MGGGWEGGRVGERGKEGNGTNEFGKGKLDGWNRRKRKQKQKRETRNKEKILEKKYTSNDLSRVIVPRVRYYIRRGFRDEKPFFTTFTKNTYDRLTL